VAYREAAGRTIYRTRIRWIRIVGVFIVVAAIGAALGHQPLASSSLTEPSSWTAAPAIDALRGDDGPALGEAGGSIPEGTSPFDEDVPGVANLDPALLGALRRAATDAEYDGVGFVVDSGWRSPEYQQQLLQQAVSEYGSEAEAARWVATPDKSLHVSGDAVDIGPSEATAWLSQHGAEYGLCQIYGNEPWHYERVPDARENGCPPMYIDPTHDPRMQK
jgi:hypothetical protein